MPLTKRTEGGSSASRCRCEDEARASNLPSTTKSKPPASSPMAPGMTDDALDSIQIAGRISSYKDFDKIGAGAFADVWEARSRRSGNKVTVKSLRAGGGGGKQALLREAALLASCAGNPAVVELRKVVRGGADNDKLYLVMEYVGPSLHCVMAARRRAGRPPFTEADARRAMRRLLRGVEAMHGRGVMHYDLKPSNVLVGKEDGRGRGQVLKICDLGLARSAAVPPPPDASSSRAVQGTLWYMAPERLMGDTGCGAPVDMWSLGCVMAELLAGKPIFQWSREPEQLCEIVCLLGVPDEVSLMPLRVSASTPSQLRGVVPEERLSPAGFDVLRGLLEFDPRDRLTAVAALQMPWFAVQDEDDAPSPARA